MRVITLTVTFLLCFAVIFFSAEGALSQQPVEPSPAVGQKSSGTESEASRSGSMDDVGRVLIVFLVLSVVFEVALTPIFNWRVFMAFLEGKGYKTPITVALAFIVFWGYGLDIIKDLLVALGRPASKSIGGQVLTALLIAGGSSGVFQIFTKLKIRMDPEEREKKTEEARAAVTARRAAAQKNELKG